jgi:hypothetical protein
VDAVGVLADPPGARELEPLVDVRAHPQHRRPGNDFRSRAEADARGVLAEHPVARAVERRGHRRLPVRAWRRDEQRPAVGLDRGSV